MGLLMILALAGIGWAVLTGRVARPAGRQIAALVLAVAGGLVAARGRLLVGGLMAGAGLLWLTVRSRPVPAVRPVDDARCREALDLLGLGADADRAAVVEAHRRLIARLHPDVGGTEALARSINGARDYLLARLPE